MDRLPQKLIDRIHNTIGDDVRASDLAVVSHRFQHAVETRTFRALNIPATDHELRYFEEVVTRERFPYIRKLTLSIPLPSAFGPEPDEHYERYNKSTTDMLQRFFGHIRNVSMSHQDIYPCFSLTIGYIERKSPNNWPNPTALVHSLLEPRCGAAGLPTLSCVRSFTISNHCNTRIVSPTVAGVLTSKFPNLERVEWTLTSGGQWSDYAVEKRYWDALDKTLSSITLPKPVKRFVCRSQSTDRISMAHYDSIGRSLRELTREHSSITLSGTFGLSLFGKDPSLGNTDLYWQNTTDLDISVELGPGNQAEGAYLRDPLLYDAVRNRNKVYKYLEMFAYNCSVMPRLQLAKLCVRYCSEHTHGLRVIYSGPGEEGIPPGEAYVSEYGGPNREPPEILQRILRVGPSLVRTMAWGY